MPRKKQIVNPIPGKRLKEILEETKTTQIHLSSLIHLSQQVISQIAQGNASLLPDRAKDIIALFPERHYRIEWLLGIDDYKTDADKIAALINKSRNEADLLFTGLCFFASLNGFTITSPTEKLNGTSTPDETVLQAFKDGYSVCKAGKSVTLTIEEMNHLENDVCDYVEYRLNRWMQKGR